MSHFVAAIVGLLIGSLIGALSRYHGYISPPNWSALAKTADAMMCSWATWLGHTLLRPASLPTEPGRLPQLLLQDVNEGWGRCPAPDHWPIRPPDLVQVVTRLEYVIQNPIFDWESVYKAGILERPVPQRDPVYWLPEGPLPDSFATFRGLGDPIVLSAQDINAPMWHAVATGILLFIGVVVVRHSIPSPESGDSQSDHPPEACELATNQADDQAEPVPPEAESESSEAQAELPQVESEPLEAEAGPSTSTHEASEKNDADRRPDQERVGRHLIGDVSNNNAYAPKQRRSRPPGAKDRKPCDPTKEARTDPGAELKDIVEARNVSGEATLEEAIELARMFPLSYGGSGVHKPTEMLPVLYYQLKDLMCRYSLATKDDKAFPAAPVIIRWIHNQLNARGYNNPRDPICVDRSNIEEMPIFRRELTTRLNATGEDLMDANIAATLLEFLVGYHVRSSEKSTISPELQALIEAAYNRIWPEVENVRFLHSMDYRMNAGDLVYTFLQILSVMLLEPEGVARSPSRARNVDSRAVSKVVASILHNVDWVSLMGRVVLLPTLPLDGHSLSLSQYDTIKADWRASKQIKVHCKVLFGYDQDAFLALTPSFPDWKKTHDFIKLQIYNNQHPKIIDHFRQTEEIWDFMGQALGFHKIAVKRCAYMGCLNSGAIYETKLKACGNCCKVHYCSQRCQAAWAPLFGELGFASVGLLPGAIEDNVAA
ncbi:hypothetical protein RhiJN_16633 [Ceratobasidium sp. AG-Ba]|nr:hypothetical protein RhiJN_16633 [Ceratobasidium sp. AG-Ba]